MPRLEKPFYHPVTELFEATKPLDGEGVPYEADLPDHLKDRYQHYWKIAGQRGSTSKGICKHCHEKRTFSNSSSKYSHEEEYDTGKAWRTYRGSGANGVNEEDDGN